MEMKNNLSNSPNFKYLMSSLEASSQQNNHVGASRDSVIALPLKFSLKLGAKQEAQVAEKDLLDDNTIHLSSTSSKAEITTLNKLHDKFQSTPTLNEFEEQDFLVECNTSKGIHVSIDGFISIEHVKNIVDEAITNAYGTRVQVFKSYMKPYTKRIKQLRMPENYQHPKFQQFNGHGNPRQHIAHFIETCNNAGIDGDLFVKQSRRCF
ncbi:hypothetical protein Sango_2436400 [Sesamum angolense]|uniref:Ty3-gypsy retrotransposon protein n=1 Tax=Sesamum angolense TaxID=2727404 RepID=A0AAE1W7N9_9LAMI|nr:hypothetical protein Sango_2436400 [Sesamum angolense]